MCSSKVRVHLGASSKRGLPDQEAGNTTMLLWKAVNKLPSKAVNKMAVNKLLSMAVFDRVVSVIEAAKAGEAAKLLVISMLLLARPARPSPIQIMCMPASVVSQC